MMEEKAKKKGFGEIIDEMDDPERSRVREGFGGLHRGRD